MFLLKNLFDLFIQINYEYPTIAIGWMKKEDFVC